MDKQESSPTHTVLVGVGAGIAAYKVAFVVRGLKARGVDVHVLPTEASLNFVGTATWVELSQNPVTTSVFSGEGPGHVALAAEADLVILAPATADLLARVAQGAASDLLTTTVLATAAPMIAFPAMHTQMWLAPATQDNVRTLRSRGVRVVDPDDGPLSSGDTGPGRLPSPERIIAEAMDLLNCSGPLTGRRILVTAGGNQEPIDPVRYVGNRSTGTQGYALAEAALSLGAEVTVIRAAATAEAPTESPRLHFIDALSAESMYDAVHAHLADCDALIMAAAVADYAPADLSDRKLKKKPDVDILELRLKKTPDILRTVASSPQRPAVLVGFGAETGTPAEVAEMGAAKAKSKGADILAVNRVGGGRGFGAVPNELLYFDAEGQFLGTAAGTKPQVAADLIGRVSTLLDVKDTD